jgi:tripartite ATP-independent transporter DctM subunit
MTRGALIRRAEDGLAFFALIGLVLLFFVDLAFLRSGLVPSLDVGLAKQAFMVLLCYSGVILTSREGKHLSLLARSKESSTALEKAGDAAGLLTSMAIGTSLFINSLTYASASWAGASSVLFIPFSAFVSLMPLAFLYIAWRFAKDAPESLKPGTRKAVIAAGIAIGLLFSWFSILTLLAGSEDPKGSFLALAEATAPVSGLVMWIYQNLNIPLIILIAASGFAGAPIFVVLMGSSMLLLGAQNHGLPPDLADLTAEMPELRFSMITENFFENSDELATASMSILRDKLNFIPAIPLFTLAGYILFESKSSERLVAAAKAIFGWLPGGLAVVCILLCTFFTTFTGATGVTIIALGSLLALVLSESGKYPENFTHGLITSSGSIGILFPPSIAVILYGSVSSITSGTSANPESMAVGIDGLFKASLLPGTLIVLALSAYCIFYSVRKKVPLAPFHFTDAALKLLKALPELLIPVIIVVGYFVGAFLSIDIAIAVLIYIVLVETLLYRDLKLKDLGRIVLKAIPVIGGILIIMVSAQSLSDAVNKGDFPSQLSAWISSVVQDRFVFLLLVNGILLATGCLLDIFSATFVVAPMLMSVNAALDPSIAVSPLHLGAIFLTNLSIGYITPPIGMNLFIGSYAFGKPVDRIFKAVIPFFAIELAVLALVTYVPWFSLALV